LAQELGVIRLDDECSIIDADKNVVRCESGMAIPFDNLVVAAGARSGDLLGDLGGLEMLQGVGSAFVIDKAPSLQPLMSQVIRTVNRGGAQCGFHTVPRSDGRLYLGAGNYIVRPDYANHRLETLRYLFSVFEGELLGQANSYPLTGQPVLGLRPRGLDGFPLVGVLTAAPNVAVVTGMNRVGFTWAPEFATEVVAWLGGRDAFSRYETWKPDRRPIPFASDQQALDYFVESRLSAALEHGMVSLDPLELQSKKDELLGVGQSLQAAMKEFIELPDGFSLTPDHWNPLTQAYDASCER
jgi:glycine/D-amino acid oxidase-like deaminating enzyme